MSKLAQLTTSQLAVKEGCSGACHAGKTRAKGTMNFQVSVPLDRLVTTGTHEDLRKESEGGSIV